jgi:DNA-directed RNA polymerase beta' subunit
MQENPTPEYTQTVEALAAARIPSDFLFEHATEEQKNVYREAHLAQLTLFTTDMQTKIQETLTSGQMLQVRKLEMQLMPELGIPFPSMFDPLDLTEDQKTEMKEIADELKPEFDCLTMELATLKSERLTSAYESLSEMSFSSLEELHKARDDVFRRYVPSEDMRKRIADLQERGKKLVATLQTRLMDVLTDEQLLKMQKILDETPEFVKKLLAQMKAVRVEQEKSPAYVPGPDSWRPGDPLPAQFKEERKRTGRGFPRSE